jgi:hypothetical protein
MGSAIHVVQAERAPFPTNAGKSPGRRAESQNERGPGEPGPLDAADVVSSYGVAWLVPEQLVVVYQPVAPGPVTDQLAFPTDAPMQ